MISFIRRQDKWLILSFLPLVFLFNNLTNCLLSLSFLCFMLIYEKKLLRFIFNLGFFLFLVFTIFVPLLAGFSIEKLIENSNIVLRGTLFIFTVFILLKDIQSSKVFKYFERFMPDELKKIIKLGLSTFPHIKNIINLAISDFIKNKKFSSDIFIKIFDNIISLAQDLEFSQNKHNIHIITGKVHEGKSSLAYKMAQEMIKDGKKVGGIISESINQDGKRIGYNAVDIKTGLKDTLATVNKIKNCSEIIGRFYFYKDGLNFALNSLDINYLGAVDIVFVDEVGRLELEEKGFYECINNLLHSKIKTIYLVVRDEFITDVQEKFKFEAQNIIRV